MKKEFKVERKFSKKEILLNRGKYVYSSDDNLLHDKTCHHINKIPFEKLNMSKKLISEKIPCKDCFRQMVVRAVYIHEYNDTYNYYWFFAKAGVPRMKLWEYLTDDELRIRMENRNIMNIRCREDFWKIIYDEDKDMFKLLHNNYKVTENLQREFFDTFHEQETHISTLLGLLHYIKAYKWDESHMKSKGVFLVEEEVFDEDKEDRIISLEHTSGDSVATGYNRKAKGSYSYSDILKDLYNTKK